jgi:MSHA biogenesis protein MshN
MSVINKMLRDLDKRGGLGPRNVEDGLRELNRAPAPERSRPWGRVAIAVAALAVGGAAGWYVLQSASRAPQAVAQAPKKAEPAAPKPAPAAEAPKPVAEPPKVVAVAEAPKAVEPPKVVAEAPKAVEPPKPTEAPKAAAPEPVKVAAAPAKVESAPPKPASAPAKAEPMTTLIGAAKSSVEAQKAAVAKSEVATATLPPAKAASVAAATATAAATPPAPPPPAPAISMKPSTAPAPGETRVAIERADRGATGTSRAAAEYRSANDLLAQGRLEAAVARYGDALRSDPRHVPARQSLVVLMLEQGRSADAQGLLRDGINAVPTNTQWPMLLARLQVEGGDMASATQTLERSLAQAQGQAEYHAFLATVLQMQSRHGDAIPQYEASLRLNPDSGRWLTGLAISLEEEKRVPEARDAYRRALAAGGLGPQLEAFAERKLKQLQ